jgi:hypothetical protein
MPRWASRPTLEITAVRAEQLQLVSEADAKAEGVVLQRSNVVCACEGPAEEPGPHLPHCRWRDPGVDPDDLHSHQVEFAILWNSINGKRPGCAWDDSPWVWVIEFKRIEVANV